MDKFLLVAVFLIGLFWDLFEVNLIGTTSAKLLFLVLVLQFLAKNLRIFRKDKIRVRR